MRRPKWGFSRGQTGGVTEPGGRPPIDAGLGVPTPWDDSAPAIDVDGIQEALAVLLRKGLPATTTSAGALLDLRSVRARATHPYDPQSQLQALNRLLVRLLAEWEGNEGEAMRCLFGVAAGTGGTTLTFRRQKAAAVHGYEETYFRQEVEKRYLRQVAEALYQDLLRFKRRVRRAAEAEEPTGDTPSLGASDLTHEEELISRIWQHVYGLRAELIAVGRLGFEDDMQAVVEDHRHAAERTVRQLRALIAEYTDTYGTDLVRHGDAEYSADALERLAGWTP